jgi:aminoglycoside phosphotransferase (APT) family kinase protein
VSDNSTRTDPSDWHSETDHRSSRDLGAVRMGLQKALAAHVPDGWDHEIGELAGTSENGMSSETLLFEAAWQEPGGPRRERLVARVAPFDDDVPVFPEYDLPGQFKTIRTVADLTDVPVPEPWWCEPDPAAIGSPFFVMTRIDGQVPPDVMPYNFGDSWLAKASAAEQSRLQESTIGVLARLHAIADPEWHFAHLLGTWPGETALRRHVAKRWDWYQFAARDAGRSELLEKGFAWLDENWPADSPTVFCWGDSRIGNVMYRDFEPVAVLDWEMAGVGPAETDLGWMVYLHQMFEDMAARYGFPGMPHFLRPDDAAATYERLSGHAPRDLDWYITYACLQLGIVYLRTGLRAVRFGERAAPDDPEELVTNASTIAQRIGA